MTEQSGLDAWTQSNRERTKPHEHIYKTQDGELWVCDCGESLSRPKCEGCEE